MSGPKCIHIMIIEQHSEALGRIRVKMLRITTVGRYNYPSIRLSNQDWSRMDPTQNELSLISILLKFCPSSRGNKYCKIVFYSLNLSYYSNLWLNDSIENAKVNIIKSLNLRATRDKIECSFNGRAGACAKFKAKLLFNFNLIPHFNSLLVFSLFIQFINSRSFHRSVAAC